MKDGLNEDLRARGQSSVRRRLVLSTAGLTAFAMTVMIFAVQLVLARVVTSNVNRVLDDRARAVLSTVNSRNPVPDISVGAEERLAAGVLVFDRAGRLRAGDVPDDLERVIGRLSTTRERRFVDVGESERLLAVPFGQGIGGVMIVGEPLGPYERSEAYALLLTLVLGVVVTAGAALIAALVVRRTLRPVVAMARTANDWSEHDLLRRFDLGPPSDEITALAATLDRLLDRVAAALRTEQRLTGDIAHELRTPLTTIIGTADLALLEGGARDDPQDAFLEIKQAARRLDDTVTTLVELAREPGDLTGARATVGDTLDLLGERVTVLAEEQARAVVLGVPERLVLRALSPVVENAVKYGRCARVTVRVSPATVDFVVNDDGPGLREGQDPFQPGPRGSGTGLGLALSRRVARSGGGDVTTEHTLSGAQFVVQLPRY